MSNRTTITHDRPLAHGFEEQCTLAPSNQALFIDGRFYSYSELLEKSEIIFAQLDLANIPNLVGIYTSESVWTYAAILAVSMCGACYVPLNSKLPTQKITAIIDESTVSLILTETKLLFSHSAQEIVIDKENNKRTKITPIVKQDLAYLLFTSGTTGEPKGVPVSKKNAQAFFDHYKNNFDFGAKDKFLQPYELSFDVSVFSMFAAWNCGACVYVVPEAGFKYLNCMTMIKEQGITVSSMVPTVLQYVEKYLDEFSFPSLRYSFFSGDKLFQHLAVKWKKAAFNAKIYNCYGPTETTIVCTSYLWEEKTSAEESENNIVPLGKPFENMDLVFLDEENTVNKSSGELCFSGAQVVDAYLGKKNESSFFDWETKRYYKTGDLATLNKNGNLIFKGRKDSQVKINGYRVELAEVEHTLYQLLKKNVLVIAVEEKNINALVAFVEGSPAELNIKERLGEILPAYMIPNYFNFIAEFPKNENDKIDRLQLIQSVNANRTI